MMLTYNAFVMTTDGPEENANHLDLSVLYMYMYIIIERRNNSLAPKQSIPNWLDVIDKQIDAYTRKIFHFGIGIKAN